MQGGGDLCGVEWARKGWIWGPRVRGSQPARAMTDKNHCGRSMVSKLKGKGCGEAGVTEGGLRRHRAGEEGALA